MSRTDVDSVRYVMHAQEDHKRALQVDPFMPRTRWKLAIPFISKVMPSFKPLLH